VVRHSKKVVLGIQEAAACLNGCASKESLAQVQPRRPQMPQTSRRRRRLNAGDSIRRRRSRGRGGGGGGGGTGMVARGRTPSCVIIPGRRRQGALPGLRKPRPHGAKRSAVGGEPDGPAPRDIRTYVTGTRRRPAGPEWFDVGFKGDMKNGKGNVLPRRAGPATR